MSNSPRRTLRVRNAFLMTLGLMGGLAAPRFALAAPEIVTDAPPPPPRVEQAPPHRDGYVWDAGHWEWNGRFYTWVSGTWIVERRNAHWVADRWEPQGTQWRFLPGHWEH
jgi:hypothetical protein